MKSGIMKVLVVLAFGCALAMAVDVTNVQAKQRWPWSGKVDICYTLVSDNTNGTFNISFDCLDGETPVIMKAYSGDGATGTTTGIGTKVLTWDASIDYDGKFSSAVTFGITATEVAPVLITYMKIDLLNGKVTTEEMASNKTDWTDADKSRYMWLRKIPAGTFTMGSATDEIGKAYDSSEDEHTVTLTKDFYAGVFEMTEAQYNLIQESGATTNTRAKVAITYNALRGTVEGAKFPGESGVDESSVIGKLRSLCLGLYDFDLPTEAQWEYACKAGTHGTWNEGSQILADWYEDANLNNIGWYIINGWDGPKEVGQLVPNAWGLYDMHGNVGEWCLDWYQYDITSLTTDPVGPASGDARVIRSGGYEFPHACRSAARSSKDPSECYFEGARIFLTVQP